MENMSEMNTIICNPGGKDERCISGPVETYKLSREEIEKKYGPVEPPKERFKKVWPDVGEPNEYHISKKSHADEEEVLDIDLGLGEEDDMDPAWNFDRPRK